MLAIASIETPRQRFSSPYLDDEANMRDLVSQMPEMARTQYDDNFGHRGVEAAFVGRVFVAYKAKGRAPDGACNPPEILNLIKVTSFEVTAEDGARVTLVEQNEGNRQVVTYVPERLFGMPIYVSIPPRLTVRWDVHEADGKMFRSLAFALLVKTRNRSDFCSKGNTYLQTPNGFHKMYAGVMDDFRF